MTGLSLGPRASGAVNTVAASGDPSFADSPLALENAYAIRLARVEPPMNIRVGLRMRWPGIGSRSFVLQSGTAGRCSPRQVALRIGGRRRVEPPGWAGRLGLLAPTPQGTSLEQGGQACKSDITCMGLCVWGRIFGGGSVVEASSFRLKAGTSSRQKMGWRW